MFAQSEGDSIVKLSYENRLQQALDSANNAEDQNAYSRAFVMLDDLFTAYPDRMDVEGFYEAAILACKVNRTEKAFRYLSSVVDAESEEGPGWIFIIGKYCDDAFQVLQSDSRWGELVERARENKTKFYHSLQLQKSEFFNCKGDRQNLDAETAGLKGKQLYEALRSSRGYLPKKQRNYSIMYAVNDTLQSSYFVRLPEQYTPEKAYPLLVCLHGAVQYSELEDFVANWVLGNFNRFYVSEADRNDVILVFPLANKQFNWMYPDDGFFMVPEIVRQVKEAVHVDDDKVFVAGHSNGATGAFAYWMKQPSPFAGCFGLNTYPKVWKAGTFLLNGKNRFFVNFSTDQDYYYPPQANDSLDVLTRELGLDYQDYRYTGYPHWFPEFDASLPAFQIIFEEIGKRSRHPFPKEIYRETDHVKYGRVDWLEITRLDTLLPRAQWHKNYNFPISNWLEYNDKDELVSKQVDKKAFDFPSASGVVKAVYAGNVFNVQTSCIGAFRLYISPEMVNIHKKVKVYVNGKLYFDGKVKWSDAFLKDTFLQDFDRQQLWINCIDIE